MALTLYVIRHCQPADQEPGYSGEPNPPLGVMGLRQAQLIAGRAADWSIDALYSSSMRRAMQTAEPIHNLLKVDWHVWPALSETSRRSWPALRQAGGAAVRSTPAEQGRTAYPPIAEAYPHVLLSQPFEPSDRWVYREETRVQAYARGRKVIEALLGRYNGLNRKLAVVCHAAFGSLLLTLLSEGTPCDHNRFSFAHGAVTRVDLEKAPGTGRALAAIRYVNDLRHFPADMITEGYAGG